MSKHLRHTFLVPIPYLPLGHDSHLVVRASDHLETIQIRQSICKGDLFVPSSLDAIRGMITSFQMALITKGLVVGCYLGILAKSL